MKGTMEAIAMGLAGEGIEDSIPSALRDGLGEIAGAIRDAGEMIAEAIKDSSGE
jgi:hypothetical protein